MPKMPSESASETDPYVARLMRRLDRYNCRTEFNRLIALGVRKEELLRRLICLAAYSPKLEPRKPSERMARHYAGTLRETARLLEKLSSHYYGYLLSGSDWRQTLQLPHLLREYADRLENWPGSIEARWQPVRTTAMCQLVWCVKNDTGQYHDALVAPLIAALIFEGKSYAEAFKQWRNRHTSDIDTLGPLNVLPHIPRPPHKLR